MISCKMTIHFLKIFNHNTFSHTVQLGKCEHDWSCIKLCNSHVFGVRPAFIARNHLFSAYINIHLLCCASSFIPCFFLCHPQPSRTERRTILRARRSRQQIRNAFRGSSEREHLRLGVFLAEPHIVSGKCTQNSNKNFHIISNVFIYFDVVRFFLHFSNNGWFWYMDKPNKYRTHPSSKRAPWDPSTAVTRLTSVYEHNRLNL